MKSLEIAAILIELENKIKGARIRNIYQTEKKTLILKLYKAEESPFHLLVKAGERLHLTYHYAKKPRVPPSFCKALRKRLRNNVITNITQHEFERIISVETENNTHVPVKIIFELFGEGNIILVDENGTIQLALFQKKMRDRNILKGETYQHPPSSGLNPLTIQPSDLRDLRRFEGVAVVKALTKLLSMSSSYIEEVLQRAEVKKDEHCDSLTDDQIHQLYKILRDFIGNIVDRRLAPCKVLNDQGRWIDVTPFPLKKYKMLKCEKVKSFNETVDKYYAEQAVVQEVTDVSERFLREVAREQRILKSQKEALEKNRQQAERFKRIGDIIYANFHHLERLLLNIRKRRDSGKTWTEISSEIEKEKKQSLLPSLYFNSFGLKKQTINLSIDGVAITINRRKSIQENAAIYYEKAKKAKKKRVGVETAMKETLIRVQKLEREEKDAITKTVKPVRTIPKKAWYEKFRWFYTSDNFLVIGGRDAVQNEVLIKKHMDTHDVVLHADIAGAPFALIKTQGKQPSEQTISEAAQLTASYSRAWKVNFSSIDVYWVKPEQVSKTPPSGEYLKKGMFMIRGKKNYIRKVTLALAIGVNTESPQPTVLGGPVAAVKSRTKTYVEIAPGDLTSRSLATKVLKRMRILVPREKRNHLSDTFIEEIQMFIPYGKGMIRTHTRA